MKEFIFRKLHKIPGRTFLCISLFCFSILSFSQFVDSGIDLGTSSHTICQWGDYDNDGDEDFLTE